MVATSENVRITVMGRCKRGFQFSDTLYITPDENPVTVGIREATRMSGGLWGYLDTATVYDESMNRIATIR